MSSGCRGRAEGTEAKAPKSICHGLLSSLHRHGLQSSQLRHGRQSSQLHHGLLSSQLRHGPCLSVTLWRSPSCVPVRVCPEGPPERPPPPPRWNCYGVGHAFREGGVMSGFCYACHLFLPLVSIFGLFPVLVSCRYELICVQLCVCDCVNCPVLIALCILVLSFEFDFIWSTRYFPGVSCL